MPSVIAKLEQEAADNMVGVRKQYLTRELDKIPEAARYGKLFLDVRVPCVFKGINGNKRLIELQVSREMMNRLVESKFEISYSGRTIDVLFRLPRSTLVPPTQEAAGLPQDAPKV